ncbi:hypothetical protein FB451DRAFT_1187994 [Mycena latifolia]|nr:hypothetical protein FB451DRAFT_1187994 [Mycena latifolia]
MSTTANDGTSGNHGNDGNGDKGIGRGGRDCLGSADPEQQANNKAERKEERRAQEAERDRREAEIFRRHAGRPEGTQNGEIPLESEVDEVPPEVAEAGPRTRIDDLWRFDLRYDNLFSRLQNFYRRLNELLRRVRRAEDGAEISLNEIFERREDIVREMEEAEAALGEEAEGSGDSESRNGDDEDEEAAGLGEDDEGCRGSWPEGFGDDGAKSPEGAGSAGSVEEEDAEGEKEEKEHPKYAVDILQHTNSYDFAQVY